MKVFRLEMFGSSCTFDKLDDLLAEVKTVLQEGDDTEVVISSEDMAEEDYGQLPEFQGW